MTPEPTSAAVFGEIYRHGTWHPRVRSGIGSEPRHTGRYREVLQRTIRELGVRSVVDLGCGDWSTARLIDWRGLDYLGVDVVPELIAVNDSLYGRDGIRFAVVDLLDRAAGLPPADLAICKDVLQHWPNRAVQRFLAALSPFRHVVLVNDVRHDRRRWFRPWQRQESGLANSDIELGDWRPLRLREPPFGLRAEHVDTYPVNAGGRRWHKEILLWTRGAVP